MPITSVPNQPFAIMTLLHVCPDPSILPSTHQSILFVDHFRVTCTLHPLVLYFWSNIYIQWNVYILSVIKHIIYTTQPLSRYRMLPSPEKVSLCAFPVSPFSYTPEATSFVFYFYSITFTDSRISLYGIIAWLLLRSMLFLRFMHMVVAIIYSFSLLSSSVPLFKHSLFVHFSRVFLIFLFLFIYHY